MFRAVLFLNVLIAAVAVAPIAESVAFWGFLGGSSSPPWVSLLSGQEDEFLGLQERYLPLGAEAYGCSPPAVQTRKDLELLERATGTQ